MSTPFNNEDIFLGRQPIVDHKHGIVAYELLFRTAHDKNTADVSDDLLATASVIIQAFTELGIEDVLGNNRGFINVSYDLLMSELVELLPKERVVLELLESIFPSEEVIGRCQVLKERGFMLALDDFVFNDAFIPLLDIVDVVKVELPALTDTELRDQVQRLRNWPVQLLAEKVDTPRQAEYCASLGFELFQGYYFAKPAILSGKRADPAKLALLRLVGLVLGDAETHEIVQEFKRDPGLTYNLLRLVNSVAFGTHRQITSLNHAISILGRRQLQRWLQLLLFTHAPGAAMLNDPLLILAATRGRLMELLTQLAFPNNRDMEDQGFMVGIMSLLDALLGMPLEQVLDQLHLTDKVRAALLHRQGALSTLLRLTEQLEQNDYDGVLAILDTQPEISLGQLTVAQLEALGWATSISTPAEESDKNA